MNKSQSSDYLTIFTTDDGSITLRSSAFKEGFHNSSGAKKEAQEKFINPSELHRYKKDQTLNVLDVCMGMGYNSACLMEELIRRKLFLNWWGLEIDKRPLSIALNNKTFLSHWNIKTIKNLEMVRNTNYWKSQLGEGRILWGDARQKILEIPTGVNFDLIYMDAFSPQQCPELWTEEFLNRLAQKLSIGGRLMTYSRAAAIRGSLRRAGLKIKSLTPLKYSYKHWSNGTTCIKEISCKKNKENDCFGNTLSEMEEEHLLTIAAIPYRDPTYKSTKIEIIKRRKDEQKVSKLKTTSSWKKRWISTKS